MSERTGLRPATYRCRCEQCGWIGYRLGYFMDRDGAPSTPETRVHVDACPRCAAEDVHGLSPRVECWWR